MSALRALACAAGRRWRRRDDLDRALFRAGLAVALVAGLLL